ncbi:MAG: Ig-like domain-containing protein [Silvibacterium sp.]|nr:Ig-like domain-containing protein [Silvibacterium sp.]
MPARLPADYKIVTLTPNANLSAGATYYIYIRYNAALYGIGGNRLSGTYMSFTTQ